MKFIATYAPTFFGYIISVLAMVGGMKPPQPLPSLRRTILRYIQYLNTEALLFFSISQSYLDPKNSSSLGNCFLLAELGPPFSPSFGVWIAGLALDNIMFKADTVELGDKELFGHPKIVP